MAARSKAWTVFQRVGFTMIVLLSLLTILYVLRVLVITPWVSYTYVGSKILANQLVNNLLLLAHVLGAYPTLLLGPFLMWPRFRARYLRAHRWMGKVYVFGVLGSAVIGFALATANDHGIWAKLGFGTLACVWFTTTFLAWRKIMNHDEVGHRRWMLRSYAISLAVVTVRFITLPPAGLTKDEWYPIMTWACWVPNLIMAELYVRLTDHAGRFAFPRIPGRVAREP